MFWSSLESLCLAVVSFVMLAMLARHLDADTFGRAALALGAVQIACSLVESYFHDAVVQRTVLELGEVDAAHTCGVLVAVMLAAGVVTWWWFARPTAPDISAPAGPGVAELMVWMSPSLLLSAWSALSIARLRRELSMRRLALASAGSRLLAGVAAITALSQGAGVWAMVVNQNLASLVLVLALSGSGAPAARLTRHLSPALRLAGYASWNSMAGLLNANMSRVFQVACGYLFPVAVVGQLALALRIVDMLVSVLVTGVARVALARLSDAARNGGALVDVFVATSHRLCVVMVPVLVLLGVLAEPLVHFVGHGGWGPAARLTAWFAAAQALRSPTFLAGTLFLAIGRPRLGVVLSFLELGSLIVMLLLLRDPVAWAARVVLVVPLLWLMLGLRFGIGPKALATAAGVPFSAALVMGAVLAAALPALGRVPLTPLVGLCLAGASGLLIYGMLTLSMTATLQFAASRRQTAATGTLTS